MSSKDRTAMSDDAWSAATLFKHYPAMKLVFNTPARIHPRMGAPLTELGRRGVLLEERATDADGGGLTFTVFSKTKLKAIPRQSQKEMHRVGLPTTID